MQTSEGGLIRGHAIVVQIRDGLHTRFRHILLGKNDGYLARAVVAVIKEDYHITFLDGSQRFAVANVYDRFDKLVSYISIVGSLHGFVHILKVCTLSVNKTIVCNLHTFPAFVAVHSIETSLN